MALLTCENVALGYGSVKIAEHISFNVNEGDYLCIIGENGSGKSTLMKTCLKLVKPLEGSIVFSDGLKRSKIGYLPQQSSIQKDFPASCQEIVLSGCLNRCGFFPFYKKSDIRLAFQNMENLGISHLSKCCYGQLSGGMKQRVLLSRALCAAEKLLFLDEPAAGLDAVAAAKMYDILHRLNEKKTAIVMISHDISAVSEHSSHILYMGKGFFFFGTREEYLKELKSGIFPLSREVCR